MKLYKQVILVRSDLKLGKGKLSAQVAHASVDALLKTNKEDISKWHGQGMKKSVLKVAGLDELLEYKKKAEDACLITALITDAGHTQIPAGTVTCLAIGPDDEKRIDKITGALKLM